MSGNVGYVIEVLASAATEEPEVPTEEEPPGMDGEVPVLAETGSESVALWTGVGASVVALGVLLLVIRRVRND